VQLSLLRAGEFEDAIGKGGALRPNWTAGRALWSPDKTTDVVIGSAQAEDEVRLNPNDAANDGRTRRGCLGIRPAGSG
jgi:hypothetical protein